MKQALAILCVIGGMLCPAASAQTPAPPAQGVLGAPQKPQAVPAGPAKPPVAAPRAGVQQVAPLTSKPLATKPTPVVPPSKNTHAQKPKPSAKPAMAAGAAAGAAAAVVAKPESPPPTERPETAKPDPNKGTVTGAPVPRWAALRADEVNLRTGPGTRYPIEWLYRRRDLPVQIQREFEAWRLIEDQDGVKGWVHQATLTGRRGFVVKTADQTLRKSAAEDATPVALLNVGVVGRVRACAANATWCDVEAGGFRGWVKRDAIWGVFPDEAVN